MWCPFHWKSETWEGKWIFVTAGPETLGRFRCPATFPLHRWQPQSPGLFGSLTAGPPCCTQDTQTRKVLILLWKEAAMSLQVTPSRAALCLLFALTHHPSSFPTLDCYPHPPPWFFTSVSFILKPTEGLVKLCFLSKMNLGARGWTSHKFGERSTECFTLDSRKDFEREDRGCETSPGGRRRRAI